MHPETVRAEAARLRGLGFSVSAVARELGVSRWAVKAWEADPRPRGRASQCPICEQLPLPKGPYAALIGYYLGDGCISQAARYYCLRVTCDQIYPGIIGDVEACIQALRPGRPVFRVTSQGYLDVVSNWKHWPCLFPQHGPGRKHDRPIVLDEWQRRIVEAHPGPFLRGLFHSDGCRANNWTRKVIAGAWKRYDYPRWQFTNRSADIRELCCWALDLVDIPWRQSNHQTISVSTRAGVAHLDQLIGPKA